MIRLSIAALVLCALLVGGVFWYRSRKPPEIEKLPLPTSGTELVVTPPPPPPPPPPKRRTPIPDPARDFKAGDRQIVPQVVLMENLVSEPKQIAPEGGARRRMIATAKLCVDTEGRVSDYVQMKSSGDPAFDKKLETEHRAWRFKPFVIAGKPTAVCAAHTTIVAP